MRNHRKIMIAANWKEHFTVAEASNFLHRLETQVHQRQSVEIVLFPNVLTLQPLSVQLDRRKFRLGAQDGYYVDAGAYTGEVSMAMLRDLVHYAIVGHSERRHVFGEHDDIIAKKVAAAVRNGIMPLLCVGETLQERLAGETNQILQNQISVGLMNLTAREVAASVIAYEPVWAIGTGEFAKPDQVEQAISFIRRQIEHTFGERAARLVRILYGGSVDNQNVRAYLDLDGCDGALVGGASLNAHSFSSIVETAYRVHHDKVGVRNG